MSNGTTPKPKIGLKGLKKLNLFPIEENTESKYEVGDRMNLRGLQRLAKSDQENEFTIPADDDLYDSGKDYQYTDLQVTVAELDLEDLATLKGAVTGEGLEDPFVLQEAVTDSPGEFAMAYAALHMNGYRLFRHPVVKLMSVVVDHETKSDGQTIAPYVLNFRSYKRKIDGIYRETMDVGLNDGFDWIDEIQPLPATQNTYTLTADGVSGNTKSTKIDITFAENVVLTASKLAITAGAGVTVGALTGSEKAWSLALTDVTQDSTVKIKIRPIGGQVFTTTADTVNVFKGPA